MYGNNDHLDKQVNDAITELCCALIQWGRATGRQSVLILRENHGEMAGQRMTEPGYVFRASNGIPLGKDSDDLTDEDISRPFVVQSA